MQEGDGLIELAEGETLPVVDEAGNTLGTLHADGRVLDDAGNEIGMLDDDGNVVLYEQQAGEGEWGRGWVGGAWRFGFRVWFQDSSLRTGHSVTVTVNNKGHKTCVQAENRDLSLY